MPTIDTDETEDEQHSSVALSTNEYWKNAEAQFGANVSGKRKRVPSSKMIESTTRHEDDHRKCQDTTEKETTTKKKKKKKSSCPVAANPTAAMSSAASSNVTFDNLSINEILSVRGRLVGDGVLH